MDFSAARVERLQIRDRNTRSRILQRRPVRAAPVNFPGILPQPAIG